MDMIRIVKRLESQTLSRLSKGLGFEFQFDGQNEGRTFYHRCRITAVAIGKILQFSWRYVGYEGNSLVTFELFAEGKKTRLKLTHEGIETFPNTTNKQKNSGVINHVSNTLLNFKLLII
jgi:Activator of Hsp90 ATPase homolog 1-like protein